MGPSDPPGTTYIPGLRENLHGLFTINLGVYVPEVARIRSGGEANSWVQEYHCCVRSRLGEVCGEQQDIWWQARHDEAVIDDVVCNFKEGGLSFLERFSTRDKIIQECSDRFENMWVGDPPQIILAIILFERGERQAALISLERQLKFALETGRRGHSDYVRELATTMGMKL